MRRQDMDGQCLFVCQGNGLFTFISVFFSFLNFSIFVLYVVNLSLNVMYIILCKTLNVEC